jgi:hypothetical protein
MNRILGNALALALAGASLGGCVREAHIAMPSDLATQIERLELRGMGGGTRGDFELAGARGHFTRSAKRLGILGDLVAKNRGGGSFRMEPSHLIGDLSGRCVYKEREVNVGPVALTPGRLVYVCEFARDGEPLRADLVIQDPKGAHGTLHGRAERVGSMMFEGREIGIRSIHRDQGGGLAAPTALGYMFELGGREIGAVDLNGLNKTIYAPRGGPEREAVLAASIALSIFWDPENLDL